MNGVFIRLAAVGRLWFLLALSSCTTSCPDACSSFPPPPNARTEIGHILNCRDQASGAINNFFGAPTWVVPGEMALAAIALQISGRTVEARQACAYLAGVQDPTDGAWYNQYDRQTPVDTGKSPRHTAQVLMAFYHCGYGDRMMIAKAMAYLKECAIHSCDPADGFLGGGKDASGAWLTTEWLSDNVFAAKAFEYYGLHDEATLIKTTIDKEFLNRPLNCWYRTKSGTAAPYAMAMGDFGWINFAPANWNLDVEYPVGLVAAIKARLQTAGGGFRENETSQKLMPGIGLQAHMAARAAGADDDFTGFYDWLRKTSGLVQTAPDAHGDAGGIIDWIDATGRTAPWWERFIDTSAFVVFLEKKFRF